jgi:hypothetical protein
MEPVPFYRPRNPRATPLWKLAETHYERLRREWEERFEARFGFWRGLADEAVARYLDCGIPEMGFARLRSDTCWRGEAADVLVPDAAAVPVVRESAGSGRKSNVESDITPSPRGPWKAGISGLLSS